LVPQQGVDLFKAIASAYGKLGWPCRTGAATGADQLAAELTLEAGGSVELMLPWPRYEEAWVKNLSRIHGDRVAIDAEDPMLDLDAVGAIALHDNPQALKDGARRLMARNYKIVVEADFVIAIPRPPLEGGTKHGCRVAEKYGIPVFNLSTEKGRSAFTGSDFCILGPSGETLFDLFNAGYF
jgi:hypothetical protein